MSFDMKKYLASVYESNRLGNISEKNNLYDYIAVINTRVVTFELKERTSDYQDILLEAWQNIKLYNIDELSNDSVNRLYSPREIHTSMGWFYKCECDRLLYVMPSCVYDFDWRNFKNFILSKLEEDDPLIYSNDEVKPMYLNYCDKTTKTINYAIEISNIPEHLYIRHDNIFKK